MQKNIWIINHYAAPPGMGQHDRQHILAKMLVDAGYSVTIFLASYHHLLNDSVVVNKRFRKEIIDQVEYCWVRTNKYSGNGLKRLINMFAFTLNIILGVKVIGNIPSLIWVSVPNHISILAGLFMKSYYKCTLLFEERDIWPLTLITLNKMRKFNPIILFLSYVESLAYKLSDHIITPLDNLVEFIKDKGCDYTHITVIQQPLPNINPKKYDIKMPEEYFWIGYVGSIGYSNSVYNLVYAMQKLQNISNIRCLIVGDGPQFQEIKGYCVNNEINNILFTGRVSKYESQYLISKCDVMYKGNPDVDLYKYGSASVKVVEYLSLSKPVIHASNLRNSIIEKSHGGIQIHPDNSTILAEVIMGLYENVSLVIELGKRGCDYVNREFNYEKISKILLSIISNLL